MAGPSTETIAPADKGPLRVRINAEQRAALVWMQHLFPDKYEGVSSVLSDYSLNAVVEAYRRSLQITPQAVEVAG